MGRQKAIRTQEEEEEFQRLKRKRNALNKKKYRNKKKKIQRTVQLGHLKFVNQKIY